MNWSDGFAAWAAAYRTTALVTSYVDYVVSLLSGWLDEVPDGGSLLVVTHGGIVEAIAAGLCPDADWTQFAGGAGYAQGFRAVRQDSRLFDLAPAMS